MGKDMGEAAIGLRAVADSVIRNAKRALVSNGVTIKGLASELGVSYSTVKSCLSLRRKCDLGEALRISACADSLIIGKGGAK